MTISEGKLNERIEANLTRISECFGDYHWDDRALMIEEVTLKLVKEWLVEMKVAYPSAFYVGDSGMNHMKSSLQIKIEREMWLKDWLGDMPL